MTIGTVVGRTALVIAVPEVEAAIAGVRLVHDPVAAQGVPAHVTVLFPFATPADVDEAALAELFAAHRAFDFALARVAYFDGAEPVTYLAPEPAAPFVALTRAVWARWPAYPPYGGAFPAIIPHLTVAHVHLTLDVALPIASRADRVTLLEDGNGAGWRVRGAFQLAQ